MSTDATERPITQHIHEASAWWIAGVVFALMLGVIGGSAVDAWKDVEMAKIKAAQPVKVEIERKE